jgi:NAD(P)-dependent dehydrogenase (short-subunit alcohol dehydrogenase family)
LRSMDGKVAVITGAASGLGYAMAHRFAAEGAKLVLADVAEPQLETVARELAGRGATVEARPTDVGDPESVEGLARHSFAVHGRVDIVVNNAGLVVLGKTWEIPLTQWHRVLDVNLWGVIHGIHAFVPRLIRQGGPAHVINTASMAGVMTLGSLAPYVASKHAVVGLSEVLARDLADSGVPIGVTVVCPGYVPTRLGLEDRDAPVPPPTPGAVTSDDVADRVRQAMSDGQLYVFTHPGSIDEVDRRHRVVRGEVPLV